MDWPTISTHRTSGVKLWQRSWYRRFRWLLVGVIAAFVVACSAPSPTIFSGGGAQSSGCGSPLGGPDNNPVQELYGPAAFAWTNEIRWQCVYNIKDFAGPSDTDRYKAARDAAIEGGGGVIYLPADIYYFQDDLPLGDGIVLRGDPPEQPNAKTEGFLPPTRLVFPEYEPSRTENGTPNDTAFKRIITPNPDTDSNLGLVFLDIDRGEIDLVGNPDTGRMSNRLVFSIRSNNVARPTPTVPDQTFQPGWLRYSDFSVANLSVTTRENALVANNRLNDDITDNYDQSDYQVLAANGGDTITYSEGEKVPFRYTDHHGIVVNRTKSTGFTYATSSVVEPGLFRSGITIQDNWVFKTMGSGIQAAGTGLTIRRNIISDEPDKVAWVDPRGTRQPDGVTTFENRAIDWAGHDVTIEGNSFVAYRHKIMTTSDFSADGEGILIRSCCGGTSVNGLVVRGNRGQGPIDIDKVPDVQRVLVEDNEITSTTPNRPALYINVDTSDPNALEKVMVRNNLLRGGILTLAGLGGPEVTVQKNQGEGPITYFCDVEVQENEGFTERPCVEPQQAEI